MMFTAVIFLCSLGVQCDEKTAVTTIRAPCPSETACLIEAQQRLAATAIGRDMRGLVVRVGVERRKLMEVAR
jgi:hypothetical protein